MTEEKLQALLNDMSLEEKVGQLCQIDMSTFLADAGSPTGPVSLFHLTEEQLIGAGSIICGGNANAADIAKVQQQIIEKSPHGIPALIMSDVIHGMRTIFPIPLALGCTFDEEEAETVGRISAREGAACGLHVSFAPMADVVRDPRWGRCMESMGEAPALCGAMSAGLVRGFRGSGIHKKDAMATCAKHFAGYGLVEAGKEYTSVDVSRTELYNVYFPPFQAALDAGCDMIMPAFTPVDRIPAIANRWLLQTVLRDKWSWNGTVISDWGSAGELIAHGVATDLREAAEKSFKAGMDMDMMSFAYITELKGLVEDGKIAEDDLNRSVLRILRLKNALGLFEKPVKQADAAEQERINHLPAHRKAALKAALKSCVLLKNEGVLPLKKGCKVALTGDHADNHGLLGGWSAGGQEAETPTLTEVFAKEKRVTLTPPEEADVILYAVGERQEDTGEARSKTNPALTEEQMAELARLSTLGKPVVMILFCGRPLMIEAAAALCKGVLNAWFPGSEGAEAIQRLLMGDSNPSGHLSMTFPRCLGQVPIHHDNLGTGRPDKHNGDPFVSRYLDSEGDPLYPFGYGLSYTTFKVGNVKADSAVLTEETPVTLTVTVKNTGNCQGDTAIQLYFRQTHGGMMRPVRTLVAWQRVSLAVGESQKVTFTLSKAMLNTYDADGCIVQPEGRCILAAGEDSTAPFTCEITIL